MAKKGNAGSFKPGDPRAGRPHGIPNKATADVRAAISVFAEANVGKLQEWLDRVAEDDPARAADLFVRVLEYHVPKLARTETTLDGKLDVAPPRLVIHPPSSPEHG